MVHWQHTNGMYLRREPFKDAGLYSLGTFSIVGCVSLVELTQRAAARWPQEVARI